jgi:hypothetical protein
MTLPSWLHGFGIQSGHIETVIRILFLLDAILVLLSELFPSPGQRRHSTTGIWSWFFTDVALIFVTVLRPFRVLRPILVVRRFSRASEQSRAALIAGLEESDAVPNVRTFAEVKFIALMLYAFVLALLTSASLVHAAEQTAGLGHADAVHSFADALWFCVGEMTLTGSQYGIYSASARFDSVTLMFIGLGILGLFGSILQRFIRDTMGAQSFVE